MSEAAYASLADTDLMKLFILKQTGIDNSSIFSYYCWDAKPTTYTTGMFSINKPAPTINSYYYKLYANSSTLRAMPSQSRNSTANPLGAAASMMARRSTGLARRNQPILPWAIKA